MSKQKHYVYRLTFPDGMAYIGSTSDIETRWQYNGTLYQNQPVGEAIKRVGWGSIKKEVLFYSEEGKEVEAEEKRQIALHKDRCYNCADNPEWNIEYANKPSGRRSGYVHVWTINGETKPASEWCKIYGKDQSNTLRKISNFGMSPLEAMNAPKVPKNYLRNPEKYWESVGYEYGKDKTSYVTPLEEWPGNLKVAYDLTVREAETDRMNLSNAVREMLKRSNMTKKEIADKTAKSYGTIARAIAKNNITVASLLEFANAAGYDVALIPKNDLENQIKIINEKA